KPGGRSGRGRRSLWRSHLSWKPRLLPAFVPSRESLKPRLPSQQRDENHRRILFRGRKDANSKRPKRLAGKEVKLSWRWIRRRGTSVGAWKRQMPSLVLRVDRFSRVAFSGLASLEVWATFAVEKFFFAFFRVFFA